MVWNFLKMRYSRKFYDMDFDYKRLFLITLVGVSLYFVGYFLSLEKTIIISILVKSMILISYPLLFLSVGFFTLEERRKFSMNLLPISIALTTGLALGAFYFWTLWLTVRRLPVSRRPWLLSLVSFWGRMAVTLSGFYLATQGQWENLAACLVGFFLLRQVFIHHYQPKEAELPTK